MSLAIKVIILFILVESSWGKYVVNPFAANPFADEEKQSNQEIDYFDILRGTIRAWQREAEQKYPLWTSANYMELILTRESSRLCSALGEVEKSYRIPIR
ncbi:hypothetical protein F2Q68_00019513 [Brassica cretica]|uniref:Uncharacterized protein n=1 Tax=Brassica cretica TaxID=69181 RepID=A0A8S9FZJ2_BRACR|nr:hypothetical protein F2Q68_00019513 [Brassica cretica]